jgi:NRAMP (natural resistance-associated macrophage protein)-like metal ion transporter
LNNPEATTPLANNRPPIRGAAFESELNWSEGQTQNFRTKLGLVLNKKLFAYLGPGFIVTVGFIDPGNWATNMAGGADFNYSLLWVITLSTIMLILLQHMTARLGVVTGKSLSENIREYFPKRWANIFAASIYVGCIATALAEYLGGALGLNILFGLPLWAGALLTFIFVVVLIVFHCYTKVERIILAFLAIIAGCYVLEIFIVQPDWSQALPRTFLPSVNSKSIMVAVGMLGAVVMNYDRTVNCMVPKSSRSLAQFVNYMLQQVSAVVAILCCVLIGIISTQHCFSGHKHKTGN